MQRKTDFVALKVIKMHGKIEKTEPELRFININHIMQIWQDGEDVIIELSDYEKLKIRNENINVLMDRFI
jgi:hypothetical protein